MSKRTQIAASVVGAIALASTSIAFANPLQDVQKEEQKIVRDAAKSQEKIDGLLEQSQELLAEYRSVVDQTENLKIYNDYLAGLVADQQRGIDSLQRQIDSIEETKQNIVPLMYKMIDSLEQFIKLDVPINLQERLDRVERLRDLMTQSNVTVSEQFRQVLDAYSIENEYGRRISTNEGSISVGGSSVPVDFFNLGRTSLVALTLDQSAAYVWDNGAREWQSLDDSYLGSVVTAVRIAQGLEPEDLVKLPIKAAE
ncbi:DUF3450 domain-containing protein [Agaribacter marinus]|uniref:DUF3450 domain-containing protein n=1 Tax=Agaribacter marinus TaxID=1431249 RepID=A0AA37WI73_9ALTE|nr:DUF3450 domain-containing protein [Agaribacter marinus]GLR70652.1 DUF3450 domain-containing protein [Agaribacter marinus]